MVQNSTCYKDAGIMLLLVNSRRLGTDLTHRYPTADFGERSKGMRQGGDQSGTV